MLAPRLRMRDFLTVKVQGTQKLQLNDAKGADSLYVTVAATHSGVLNGNMRFYRPDCMQATAPFWVLDGRPLKPVLLRHDKDCDPVGRVMKARYVDLSYKYNNPELRNTVFYDGRKGRKGLFESIDWIVRNLGTKDDYEGLGYVELGLKITDPVAMGKVQRDEYMTVSVGFSTDQAVCSVCHTDWAREDRCEHKLGRMYDGKRCYLVTGMHDWEEVSWVNFPADPFAAVISKQAAATAITDSLASRAFYLGLPAKERELLVMADSLEDREFVLESDIEPIAGDEEQMDLNEIVKETKADGLTKERTLELIKELEAFTGEDANEKRKATRTLNMLKALVKTNGWEPAEEKPELTKDQVEAKIASLDTVLATLKPEEKEAYIGQLADEAATFGLEFKAPAAEPETAAPATEGTDAAATEPEAAVKDVLNTEDSKKLADSKNGKKALACLEQMDSCYQSLEDGDEKYLFRNAMTTLMERWSAEGYLAYIKSRLESTDETVVSKKELDTLNDAVGKYEADLKARQADNKALLDTNKALVAAQKKNLATVIIALEIVSGNTTYTGLDSTQLQAEIDRKAKRHLISLQDAVEDLLERVPNFKVQAAAPETPQTPAEGAKEISDQAAVDSTEKPDGETDEKAAAPATDNAQGGDGTPKFPVVTLKDVSRVRKSQAVAQYRALKDQTKKTE